MPELEQIQARPIPRVFQGRVTDRATAAWRADVWDAATHSFLDLSGNGLHARSGSAAAPNTNDPLRLPFQGKCIYSPAAIGNYVSFPDGPTIPRGDFTVEIDAAATDWTPAATQALLAHDGSAGNRSMLLGFATGGGAQLRAILSTNGTATTAGNSSDMSVSDGQRVIVRYTRNAATGVLSFSYSTDSGQTFTPIGTLAGPSGDLFDTTAALEICSAAGGSASHLNGRIFRVRVWSDTTRTTLVHDFNAESLTEPYAAVADGVNGTWTLNRSATGRKLAVVDRNLLLFGTDDYLEVANNALLNFGAGAAFTLASVIRRYGTPSGSSQMFMRKSAGAARYGMDYPAASPNLTCFFTDGVTSVTASPTRASDGTLALHAAVRRGFATQFTGYSGANSASVADNAGGAISNAAVFRIGSETNGTGNFLDGEWMWAGIFPYALSTDELARLRREIIG